MKKIFLILFLSQLIFIGCMNEMMNQITNNIIFADNSSNKNDEKAESQEIIEQTGTITSVDSDYSTFVKQTNVYTVIDGIVGVANVILIDADNSSASIIFRSGDLNFTLDYNPSKNYMKVPLQKQQKEMYIQ